MFRVFGICRSFNFPMGLGVWEGLQSMGNGCGLQMDGFSTVFELCGSIFNDFHDFDDFAVVSDGLKNLYYTKKSPVFE